MTSVIARFPENASDLVDQKIFERLLRP